MAYSWDKNLLKQLKQDPIAANDLRDLYTSFWDFFRITQSERYPKSEIITSDYIYLNNHRFTEDYLINMLNLPEIKQQTYQYQNTLTAEDAFMLAHDFYQNTTPEIFDIFLRLYNKRETHFKFFRSLISSFYSGHTYIASSTGDCFIEAKQDGTISDAVIATHEYGHGIDFFINPYEEKPECYNVYSEVSSIFFELVAMDFWEKYNEFKTDIDNERHIFYTSFIDDAQILRDKFDLTYEVHNVMTQENNICFQNFFKKIRHNLALSRKELNLILKNPAESLLPYNLSALVALELYHIYQTDPDFAFYLYHRFILLKGTSANDLDHKINDLGLYPTEHLDTFTRKLKLEDSQ